MKILAASLVDTVNSFLHAGYISAYPSTLWADDLQSQDPKMVLDMADSLRLQGEVLAANGAAGASDVLVSALSSGGDTLLAGFGGSGGVGMLVAGAATLAGVAALSWAMRSSSRSLRTSALLAATAALGVGMLACGEEDPLDQPLPETVPWEGVALQDYENPEAATNAILYGLIKPALNNMAREDVTLMVHIQNAVGLPTKSPTDGMAYAMSTYGIDGWGTEFDLVKEDGQFIITSAGPDLAFDTEDDIVESFYPCDEDGWGYSRTAYYVTAEGGNYTTFFHRWDGWRMEYLHEEEALAATGSELFDLLTQDDLSADAYTRVATSYTSVTVDAQHEPLVLLVM